MTLFKGKKNNQRFKKIQIECYVWQQCNVLCIIIQRDRGEEVWGFRNWRTWLSAFCTQSPDHKCQSVIHVDKALQNKGVERQKSNGIGVGRRREQDSKKKNKKIGRIEGGGGYNKLHSILDQFPTLEQSNTDFARPGSSFRSEPPAPLNGSEAKSRCCTELTRMPDRQCSEVASPEKREVKI